MMPVNTSSFPGGSDGKAFACNAGDLGSIPGSGRSPEERNGNPLQYSCLENSTDRGAWRAKKSQEKYQTVCVTLPLAFLIFLNLLRILKRWKQLESPLISEIQTGEVHIWGLSWEKISKMHSQQPV